MSKSVYLAGPITGGSYDGVTEWRDEAKYLFDDYSWYMANDRNFIKCYSPMRHKDYLLNETSIADEYSESILSSQRGITARDRNDVMNCDLLLVNLQGAERVSIGTVIEIAWADILRKPIVAILDERHDHAMIREMIQFRAKNLEEAVFTAARILIP